MAIQIVIDISNGKAGYSYSDKDVTLSEAALANHQLDIAKARIMQLQFKPDFEASNEEEDENEGA